MTVTNDTSTTDCPATSFDQGARLLDRPSGVSCPACRRELQIGELSGSQFAGCPDCGGMMFQQEVFGALIQHLRAASNVPAAIPDPLNPEELKVRRDCPACGNALETHAYAGPGNSVIDTCFPCRIIWFDRGELTKLVNAPGRR